MTLVHSGQSDSVCLRQAFLQRLDGSAGVGDFGLQECGRVGRLAGEDDGPLNPLDISGTFASGDNVWVGSRFLNLTWDGMGLQALGSWHVSAAQRWKNGKSGGY